MKISIVNLCKDGGSGMSECKQAGMGHEKQCICSFYKESSVTSRCRFEVMEEFCDQVAAQKHAKGQPILLTDVNSYADPKPEFQEWVDTSGTLDKEIIDEATKTIEEMMKRDKMLTFDIKTDRLYKDENGEFHILESSEDILDHLFPYVDENGDIRYAESHKHKELMETKDPCSDCCHAESKGGCDPCTTKELYELNKEQEEIYSLRQHEFYHKMVKTQKSPPKIKWKGIVDVFKEKYLNQFVEERLLHHDDYYSSAPIQHRRMVNEMHSFSDWDSSEARERFGSIHYIMSRELSKATIMERHSAGFMTVVTQDQVLTDIKSLHEKLILDKQYLVLYTPTGEIALPETLDFLQSKAYNWRNLVLNAGE